MHSKEKLKQWLRDNYKGIPDRIEIWNTSIKAADSLSGPNYQQEKNPDECIRAEPYQMREGLQGYCRRCCLHYYGQSIVDPEEDIFRTNYWISAVKVTWVTENHIGFDRFAESYELELKPECPGVVKDIFNTYITPLMIALYLNGDINNDDIFWTDSEIPTMPVGYRMMHVFDVWSYVIRGERQSVVSPQELGHLTSLNILTLNTERLLYLKEVMEKALQ